MLHEKTVFVLGAGASVDYGFPLGKELKQKIIHFVGDAEGFWQGVYNYSVLGLNINSLSEAQTFIKNNLSSAKSVDEFINRHSSNENVRTVLKLAIVFSILHCELDSALFCEDEYNFDKKHEDF